MKKVLFCTMLLFIATASFSQQTETPSQRIASSDYMLKSKNQKTAAWVLLAGGAAINIIGIATFPKDYVYFDLWGNGNTPSNESKANASGALVLVGTAAMLGSIPFFIVSRANRNRALRVSIDTEHLSLLKNTNMFTTNYPAVKLKIKL